MKKYKRVVKTEDEPIYGCQRCVINNVDHPDRMCPCPCPRGSGADCEAVVIGKKTITIDYDRPLTQDELDGNCDCDNCTCHGD